MTISGLTQPTIQGRNGSPFENSYNNMNQRNASNASLAAAVSGGSMKKKGGAVTVPVVRPMYKDVGGPGQTTNDIASNTAGVSVQGAEWAKNDNLATQKGGSRKRRGGNSDWLWGCYSGGKKKKTRTNKRKTRRYRKKTRRNKK
jgi:hypothetical protein